jgi:predicted NAD-dependent protein-ADP-ribosyltransferase YbiA (DUF1768 family)
MSSTWVNQYFVKFKERCRGGIHQSYREKLSYGTPWGVPPPLPWCYYFKITNTFSYFRHVYILKTKDEAFEQFKNYYQSVTNLQKTNIVDVVTDRGGEFTLNKFKKFFLDNGIMHYITAPYTPQQNSVVERGNCTTSEKAWALLKEANLLLGMWGKLSQPRYSMKT